MNLVDWHAEAIQRFGPDPNRWRFTCPSCGLVQTRRDFLALGLEVPQVDWLLAYSCIGRFRLTDPEATVVEAFDLDVGWGCKYIGGASDSAAPVALELAPGEIRPTFGFTPPCTTCNDDRILCSRCDQRVVECNCRRWDSTFEMEYTDCADCRTT